MAPCETGAPLDYTGMAHALFHFGEGASAARVARTRISSLLRPCCICD